MERPLPAAIVGAIAACAALAVPSSAFACDAGEHLSPAEPRRGGTSPLAIGDSVMLGAVEELQAAGFEADAHGCRQMGQALGILASRSLPDVVVIALGTNGTVSTSEIRAALRILGRERVLGMVTPPEVGGVASTDQAVIRAAGRRWRRRLKVLDWVAYSSGRDWTWDGMHLKPAGAAAYARLLSRAFSWPIPSLELTLERAQVAEPADDLRPARNQRGSGGGSPRFISRGAFGRRAAL